MVEHSKDELLHGRPLGMATSSSSVFLVYLDSFYSKANNSSKTKSSFTGKETSHGHFFFSVNVRLGLGLGHVRFGLG